MLENQLTIPRFFQIRKVFYETSHLYCGSPVLLHRRDLLRRQPKKAVPQTATNDNKKVNEEEVAIQKAIASYAEAFNKGRCQSVGCTLE